MLFMHSREDLEGGVFHEPGDAGVTGRSEVVHGTDYYSLRNPK
jgi:hypothetical protein